MLVSAKGFASGAFLHGLPLLNRLLGAEIKEQLAMPESQFSLSPRAAAHPASCWCSPSVEDVTAIKPGLLDIRVTHT